MPHTGDADQSGSDTKPDGSNTEKVEKLQQSTTEYGAFESYDAIPGPGKFLLSDDSLNSCSTISSADPVRSQFEDILRKGQPQKRVDINNTHLDGKAVLPSKMAENDELHKHSATTLLDSHNVVGPSAEDPLDGKDSPFSLHDPINADEPISSMQILGRNDTRPSTGVEEVESFDAIPQIPQPNACLILDALSSATMSDVAMLYIDSVEIDYKCFNQSAAALDNFGESKSHAKYFESNTVKTNGSSSLATKISQNSKVQERDEIIINGSSVDQVKGLVVEKNIVEYETTQKQMELLRPNESSISSSATSPSSIYEVPNENTHINVQKEHLEGEKSVQNNLSRPTLNTNLRPSSLNNCISDTSERMNNRKSEQGKENEMNMMDKSQISAYNVNDAVKIMKSNSMNASYNVIDQKSQHTSEGDLNLIMHEAQHIEDESYNAIPRIRNLSSSFEEELRSSSTIKSHSTHTDGRIEENLPKLQMKPKGKSSRNIFDNNVRIHAISGSEEIVSDSVELMKQDATLGKRLQMKKVPLISSARKATLPRSNQMKSLKQKKTLKVKQAAPDEEEFESHDEIPRLGKVLPCDECPSSSSTALSSDSDQLSFIYNRRPPSSYNNKDMYDSSSYESAYMQTFAFALDFEADDEY